MSLPPDPPPTTPSSNLFLKNYCPKDGGNYTNTLFLKIKFDILKTFYVVYFVSTNKKGINSTEQARKQP